jgi:hypothetical protein
LTYACIEHCQVPVVKRDFGDFQTPPELVRAVLDTLGPVGSLWSRVLEPTCGKGNFIAGLLSRESRPKEIQAIEKQEVHAREAMRAARTDATVRTTVTIGDIFNLDLRRDISWQSSGPLLVLGNPPWVTNAELGSLNSSNLPSKINQRYLRGIDALTGESNFDLAEHIWIKILTELADEEPTVAMLCKVTVARNVLRFVHEHAVPVTDASIRKIDAKKWFRATVDACLLTVSRSTVAEPLEVPVFSDLVDTRPVSVACVRDGKLVWDGERYDRSSTIQGTCSLSWRQGIKHDAAKVMELTETSGIVRNRLGEIVDVESDYVYPLLKGSDLFNGRSDSPRFSVIVTQRHLHDDTASLREKAPKLWAYLQARQEHFARRKSSVYAGRVAFCLFGVGEYSFAEYKVAVAGFYATPRFRAVGPIRSRPVMLDDTCYFLDCASKEEAALLTSLLNDPVCLDFLKSVILLEAKRPVTKSILQRIDLHRLLELADPQLLLSRYRTALDNLGGTSTGEAGYALDCIRSLVR